MDKQCDAINYEMYYLQTAYIHWCVMSTIYNNYKLRYSPVRKHQLFCMQIHGCHVSQFSEAGPSFDVKTDISLRLDIFITKSYLYNGNTTGKTAFLHNYSDVIMITTASQITSLMIVYSTVYSGANKKHQSSASLAFVREIHRWPMNSPHKGPVTRKRILMTSSFWEGPWFVSLFENDW